MNISNGDTFTHSSDGVDFVIRKIVNDMVVLESQDGERQILTGMITLNSKSFFLKKEDKEL
jgi:hypothetical protein